MPKTNLENLIFPIPYSTPNKVQKISLREPEIATTLLDIWYVKFISYLPSIIIGKKETIIIFET